MEDLSDQFARRLVDDLLAMTADTPVRSLATAD
jgi:hypothetical protein